MFSLNNDLWNNRYTLYASVESVYELTYMFSTKFYLLLFIIIFFFCYFFLFIRNFISKVNYKWLFIQYIYIYSILLFIYLSSFILIEISIINSLYYFSCLCINSLIIIYFRGIIDRYTFFKIILSEFFLLLYFLIVGGYFLLSLQNFRDFFIVLEIITLGSYTLIAIKRDSRFSTYAGIQYFILGSLPSAMLILAFALFYYYGGSLVYLDFDFIFFINNRNNNRISITFEDYIMYNSQSLSSLFDVVAKNVFYNFNKNFEIDSVYYLDDRVGISGITSILLRGLICLFFNLFFKLTAAPFHLWAPNVYGKGPIVSVTFLAIYSKFIIFLFFFNILFTFLKYFSLFVLYLFQICGVLSIFVGIVGAFTSNQIKLFYVYSSMGHVGFRLIGLSLLNVDSLIYTFVYLIVYRLSSFYRWFLLLAIGITKTYLVQLSDRQKENVLFPLMVILFLFSMSGIPPFGGFYIKLDILSIIIQNSHFGLAFVLYLFTILSFFYYLRLIKIILFDNQTNRLSISFTTFFELDKKAYIGRLWIRIIILLCLVLFQELADNSIYNYIYYRF